MHKHNIDDVTAKYIFGLTILNSFMTDNFEEILNQIQNYKNHPCLDRADILIELLVSKLVLITELNNKLLEEKIHINQLKISILKTDLLANEWREDGYLIWHN
jgi:hypothetical protein